MKRWQIIYLLAVIVVVGLSLAACSSDSNDVASLGAMPTAVVEDEALDVEA